jgi:hypothetical protein
MLDHLHNAQTLLELYQEWAVFVESYTLHSIHPASSSSSPRVKRCWLRVLVYAANSYRLHLTALCTSSTAVESELARTQYACKQNSTGARPPVLRAKTAVCRPTAFECLCAAWLLSAWYVQVAGHKDSCIVNVLASQFSKCCVLLLKQ